NDKHQPLNLGHFSTKTPGQLSAEINIIMMIRVRLLHQTTDGDDQKKRTLRRVDPPSHRRCNTLRRLTMSELYC
ncbi:MAG: hypothetical protein K2Y56_26030, partial [Methylobacterium sp.]|uniref:hypothetical protein n=1 Tax=Methylobacterium sp. TaxID=409 RepID=UPI0025D6C4D8